MSDWTLIDSEPAVFAQMIRELGAKGVEVEELYTLDDSACDHIRGEGRAIYGFIFLFKLQPGAPRRSATNVPGIFFAKQVVNNACASQAFLSVLLNATNLELGTFLSDFKEFAMACDPETRGVCIGNSEEIRKVHNSFASKTAVAFEGHEPKDEDAFHFVAFVHSGGKILELDGLADGPIDCGEVSSARDNDWLAPAMAAIRAKVAAVQGSNANECRFTLLAVTQGRLERLYTEQSSLECDIKLAGILSSGVDCEEDPYWLAAPELQKAIVMSFPNLEEFVKNTRDKLHKLQAEIPELEAHREEQMREVARRRHDWMPFTTSMLKLMARKGLLPATSA